MIAQVGHLEGLRRPRKPARQSCRGEDRQRAIEAAAAIAERVQARVEQQKRQPVKERSRDQDYGPSM